MAAAQVIGIGGSLFDTLYVVPGYPPEDSKIKAETTLGQCGGPVATALATISRLGLPCAFVGAMGDDPAGQAMLADFAVFGVDTAAVTIRPGCQSSSCIVIISAATQTRTIVWSPGNAWTGDPVSIPAALFESAHVLHLDGLQAESALIAARRFKDSGKIVSLDAGSFHPGVDKLLPLADWLVCAESFVRRQTGAADTAEAVLALYRQYRPEVAAATQGKDGGLWTTDGQTVHRYRPMPVAAVDTTGAGDVFHGAVIYGRLHGWDWPQVFAFASAVAALKCTRLGGRTGIPTRSAVDDYLARQGVAR